MRRVLIWVSLLLACGRDGERGFPLVADDGQPSEVVSLTMALRVAGSDATVADVVRLGGRKKDGDPPLAGLFAVAAALHHPARAVRLEPGSSLAPLRPGAMLRMLNGRWAVLARATADEVTIAEPKLGLRTMPAAQAWGDFTGAAVLLEPPRPSRPHRRPELGNGPPVAAAFRYHGADIADEDVEGDLYTAAASAGLVAEPASVGDLDDLDARMLPRGTLLVEGESLTVYSGPSGPDRVEVHGKAGRSRAKRIEVAGMRVILLEPRPVASQPPAPDPPGTRRIAPILAAEDDTGGGATECLAMILRHLGRNQDLASLRAKVEADGRANAQRIIQAATARGLLARGVEVTDDAQLDGLPLPIILHWNYRHFVVLERLGADDAAILDPRAGYRRMSRDQLWRSFTGVALLFEER